jgi:hypothetical protein
VADPNDIWRLMGALADAAAAADEARRRDRAARRNTPEARQARSEAARRGWQKRHAREAAELAAEAAAEARDAELDARTGSGPWCDSMDLDATGREVFCIRDPEHDDDCEDVYGHTWPNPSTW